MSIIRPGVIALLSVLAIVAIFIFAHYDRQAKAYDEAAHRAAMRIHHLLAQQANAAKTRQIKAASESSEQQGDLREQLKAVKQAGTNSLNEPMAIDLETIKQAGLKISPNVRLKALPGPEGTPESVAVWHPRGIMEYIVSAKGVKAEYQ